MNQCPLVVAASLGYVLYNNKQNLRWEIMFLADNFQFFSSCLLLDFWTEIGSKVSGMATNIA